MKNGTIYIYGHDKVCILCKRFILNVGIKRVVIQKDDKSKPVEIDPTDWIKEL
jgi:deoxycytidylate deaminase